MNDAATNASDAGMMIRVRGKWINLRDAEAKAAAAQAKATTSPAISLRVADDRKFARCIYR